MRQSISETGGFKSRPLSFGKFMINERNSEHNTVISHGLTGLFNSTKHISGFHIFNSVFKYRTCPEGKERMRNNFEIIQQKKND